MVGTLRLVVVGVIVVLLVRAGRMAWHNRRLAFAVWHRIRPHHVLGSFGLLVLVLTVALTLMQLLPITQVGLGSLVGLSGNAVFAPLEEASLRAGGQGLASGSAGQGYGEGDGGTQVALMAGTGLFLGLLLLLFPWLAYVEERTFREGLEDRSLSGEILTALRFGLLHLVMLIPVAAALAIAVAGFAYGRIYLHAHRRAAARTDVIDGPLGLPVTVAPPPARVQGEAILASTVWHTTFNSLVVALVFVGFLAQWVIW